MLLYGLIAEHKAQKKYQVVGEFLSYDPYGIVFRKGDSQPGRRAACVPRSCGGRQYKRWFLQRLPSGESLGLPMSPQLETLIRAMAAKPE